MPSTIEVKAINDLMNTIVVPDNELSAKDLARDIGSNDFGAGIWRALTLRAGVRRLAIQRLKEAVSQNPELKDHLVQTFTEGAGDPRELKLLMHESEDNARWLHRLARVLLRQDSDVGEAAKSFSEIYRQLRSEMYSEQYFSEETRVKGRHDDDQEQPQAS